MKTNFLTLSGAVALVFTLAACAAPSEEAHMEGAEANHDGEEMKMGEGKHGGGDGDDHGSFTFGAPGMADMVTRTINISMLDNAYSIKDLNVKEGETIRFVIVNQDETPHEFTLGPSDMQSEHRLKMEVMMDQDMDMDMMHADPNAVSIGESETKELIWKFGEPAHIEFACNIPGHYEAGMKGEIIITH